jgi:hypothetical protein
LLDQYRADDAVIPRDRDLAQCSGDGLVERREIQIHAGPVGEPDIGAVGFIEVRQRAQP